MATAAPEGGAQVGLVIVTHGACGETMLRAAADIVGPVAASASVSVEPSENFADIVLRVTEACNRVDTGAGLLILADVHGSSPFRACMAMADGSRLVEVVCGVNLPMLIKLATCDRRGQPPITVADVVKEVGKRSIRLGSELTGNFNAVRVDPR